VTSTPLIENGPEIAAPARPLLPTGEPSPPSRGAIENGVVTPFPHHPVPEGARATTVPSRYFPQLPRSERDRRWDRLRKKMLLEGVDALIFLGNDIY